MEGFVGYDGALTERKAEKERERAKERMSKQRREEREGGGVGVHHGIEEL